MYIYLSIHIFKQRPKDGKGDRQVDNKQGREKKQIDDIELQANTIKEKFIDILIETEGRERVKGKYNRRKEKQRL